jgi:hypothetical protein
MLASQSPVVDSRRYDFMPNFQQLITQLYLAGVMWRFGEQFDLPTSARDRGFVCLMPMLIADGMSVKLAEKRIAELNVISRSSDGRDSIAVESGYAAELGDGSLAKVFDWFSANPQFAHQIAGAPYRLINYSKPIAAILAVAGFIIALLLGRSFGEACGVGFVLGISTLGCALAIYRRMIKASK